jgi:hypothetical protein
MVAFELALAKSCPSENHALYVCHISLANSIPCFSVIATFSRKEGITERERESVHGTNWRAAIGYIRECGSASYYIQVADFFSRQQNKNIPTSIIIIHAQLGCSFLD